MTQTRSRIAVFLVDTSATFLEAATRLLSTDSRIDIAGHALSATDAVGQMRTNWPQVVVIDIAIRPTGGLALTRTLKAMPDAPQVIVVTTFADPEYREAAHEAGADAYLAKSHCGGALLSLIHALIERQAASPNMEVARM